MGLPSIRTNVYQNTVSRDQQRPQIPLEYAAEPNAIDYTYASHLGIQFERQHTARVCSDGLGIVPFAASSFRVDALGQVARIRVGTASALHLSGRIWPSWIITRLFNPRCDSSGESVS